MFLMRPGSLKGSLLVGEQSSDVLGVKFNYG